MTYQYHLKKQLQTCTIVCITKLYCLICSGINRLYPCRGLTILLRVACHVFSNYKVKHFLAASTLRRVNFKTAFFNLSASKDLHPHGKTDRKIRIHTATMIYLINAWMHLWEYTLIANSPRFPTICEHRFVVCVFSSVCIRKTHQ